LNDRFFYLAIAFAVGFVSRTFPIRLIFSALVGLISFMSGPEFLLKGILKIREPVSETREPGWRFNMPGVSRRKQSLGAEAILTKRRRREKLPGRARNNRH
jgi:hypothetical protein